MAYIGLDRGIINHWIYEDAEYFKVWFEMLYRARYSQEPETKLIDNILVEMNYGEFIYGRTKWSERLKISERRLRTLIDKLQRDNMIESVTKFPRFTVYRIINYAKYNQQIDQQEDQSGQGIPDDSDHPNDQRPTSRRPAGDQQATTKEEGIKKGNKVNQPKEGKKEYADYVFLTETEYGKLTELLGESERDLYFLRFASWISGQTKRVQQSRSAYLSILQWHKEDEKKRKNGNVKRFDQNKPQKPNMPVYQAPSGKLEGEEKEELARVLKYLEEGA